MVAHPPRWGPAVNRPVTALCLLLVTLMACTGAPETPEPSAAPSSLASDPAPSGASSQPALSTPSAASTPSETATDPAAVLGPEWVADRDRDTVPDAVEAEVGTDPAVDGCEQESDCGGDTAGPNPLKAAERGANTLLILDASGSMAGAAGGGETKMRAAKRAITRYVVGLPDFVHAGLMVYGHVGSNDERDKDRSCKGIETFAPLGDLTHESVDGVLERFEPVGWTPIAGALDTAREEFEDSDADNRVILVSDGIETCDGDPVAAARRLSAADVSVTVDVVGFDVDAAAARQLEKVAEVTGGTYTDAPSAAQLNDYFNRQVEQLFALRDQMTCVARNRNQVTSCYHRARNQARDALFRVAQAAGDTTRADALLALAAQIEDDTGALVDSVNAASGARIEELDEQFRAARERWERRYRDSAIRTSIAPCAGPFVPLPVAWS
jgi:hypothetical protein